MHFFNRWFIGAFLIGCAVFGSCCGVQVRDRDCVTDCGLVIRDSPWSCEANKQAERTLRQKARNTNDPRLYGDCSRLAKFTAYVHKTDGGGFLSEGALVYGRTFCAGHYMLIDDRTPLESSLRHEIAHVLQNCAPLPPFDDKDYFHSNWLDGGIYEATDD